MSAVHLKPCPYCGSAARYVAADYVDNSGEPWPFAECDACNTGAPVEFWNKRAQPADQQGEPVAIVVEETHNYGQYLVFGEGLRGAHSPRPVVERKAHLLDQTLPSGTKLYRHAQPATAKVVLPEQASRENIRELMAAKSPNGNVCFDPESIWNTCLIATAKLNGGQ